MPFTALLSMSTVYASHLRYRELERAWRLVTGDLFGLVPALEPQAIRSVSLTIQCERLSSHSSAGTYYSTSCSLNAGPDGQRQAHRIRRRPKQAIPPTIITAPTAREELESQLAELEEAFAELMFVLTGEKGPLDLEKLKSALEELKAERDRLQRELADMHPPVFPMPSIPLAPYPITPWPNPLPAQPWQVTPPYQQPQSWPATGINIPIPKWTSTSANSSVGGRQAGPLNANSVR